MAYGQPIQYPVGGGTVGDRGRARGFQVSSSPTIESKPGTSQISPEMAKNMANALKSYMGTGQTAYSATQAGSAVPVVDAGFAAGTAPTGAGWTAGVGGGGAGAGGASAGGGSALSGAGAFAWPAALAAVIAWNEEDSRKKGLREEDHSKRYMDMLTGKVASQDMEGKWGPYMDKLTGDRFSGVGFTDALSGGSKFASGRFGSGFKQMLRGADPTNLKNLF